MTKKYSVLKKISWTWDQLQSSISSSIYSGDKIICKYGNKCQVGITNMFLRLSALHES